jgi:catalase (peroxidase I)
VGALASATDKAVVISIPYYKMLEQEACSARSSASMYHDMLRWGGAAGDRLAASRQHDLERGEESKVAGTVSILERWAQAFPFWSGSRPIPFF